MILHACRNCYIIYRTTHLILIVTMLHNITTSLYLYIYTGNTHECEFKIYRINCLVHVLFCFGLVFLDFVLAFSCLVLSCWYLYINFFKHSMLVIYVSAKLFSSPEHVLKKSYCDVYMSVVGHLSICLSSTLL